MKRIPSLDGFRAISIILVLLCHCVIAKGFPASLQPFARYGDVGVTVFFVISGFLITNLLLVEEEKFGEINFKAFYTRRAFRIVPVFLLYTVFIVTWSNIEKIDLSTSNTIHALTFTVNFDNDKNWFVGHFWSLSVEEQFYLLLPLLIIFFRKNIKLAIILLIGYSWFSRIIAYKFPVAINYSLSPFFNFSDAIFIGVIAALYYFKNPDLIKHRIFTNSWLQLIAVVLIAIFKYTAGSGKLGIISLPFGNTIICTSIIFLILSYINQANTFMFKLLNNKLIIHIGVLSYSIYIWQQFFFTGEIKGIWRTFPFNLVFIYLVSLASYRLWEQPFLRLKKSFKTY